MATVPLEKHVLHHPPLLVSIPDSLDNNFIDLLESVSYDFQNADHNSITELLNSIDWATILQATDLEKAALTFSHVLLYAIDRHVPK